MPSCASCEHHVQHLFDHLRVERRGRLVKEHDLGLHGQGAGDGHALLLPAGELARVDVGLFGDAHLLQQVHRRSPAPPAVLRLRTDALRQHDVVQHGEVREQVELLEDHAHSRCAPC